MKNEKTPSITLQKDIKKLLEKGVSEGVFPSAAAGIVCGLGKEKKKFITYCGNASLYPEKRILKKNNFFDLASLTKPLATTLAILCLIKEKKIDVDENLPSLLEKKIKGGKNKILIWNLLSHSSGLPAHREYFKILKDIPEIKKMSLLKISYCRKNWSITREAHIYTVILALCCLAELLKKKQDVLWHTMLKKRFCNH